MLKIAILSLSLLTVFAGAAIAPALAAIAAAFPMASATEIKSLMTAPAIAIVCVSPFAGWLARRLGRKPMLYIGLGIYMLGGIGGGLVGDFTLLYGMRLLLGVGVGILMPLSTGLIADYFSGHERLRMMGLSTAVTNFGAIVANLLAGYLTLYNWRLAFAVYGVAILTLLLVLRYIPGRDDNSDAEPLQARVPVAVYGWGVGVFLLMVGVFSLPVNMALYLSENSFGGSGQAGIAIALMTGLGFVAGLVLARMRTLFRQWLPVLLLSMLAAGFWILNQAPGLAAVYVAMGLAGFANGSLIPLLFVGGSNAGHGGGAVAAMGVMTTLTFLGQFCSPVVLDWLGYLLGDTSTRFLFAMVSWGFLGSALVVLVWVLARHRT